MSLTLEGAKDCWGPGLLSATLYVALYDADGDELTGNGYGRVAIASANWRKSATAPTADNNVILTWNAATADWEPIATVRLMSAMTGGDEKVRATLGAAVTITQNSQARIALNQLVLRFTIAT